MNTINKVKALSEVDRLFRDLLNHPALLRLKDVNLLGAIGFFSQAKGLSRYEHSLGCAELANTFLDKLHISDEDRYVLLLSALLHDVGHPPFSHSTELSLYEMFSRYHRGQASLILRNYGSHFPNVRTVQQIIMDDIYKGPIIFRKLLQTLRGINQNRGMRTPIYQILVGPTNVDTLDAITRAALGLNFSYIEPRQIIENLTYDRIEGILVNHGALSLLKKFWNIKNQVYQECIFDLRNQSIEAMVNRAVSLAYIDNINMTPFYFLTDDQLVDVLSMNQRSLFLWDLISKGRQFMPLWSELQMFTSRKGKTNLSFALQSKKFIEKWVAERLGIPESERFKVIFHVTIHKEFLLDSTRQLSMLEVSWNDLPQIFKSKRKVVFNVFIPPEMLSKQYSKKEYEVLIQEHREQIR